MSNLTQTTANQVITNLFPNVTLPNIVMVTTNELENILKNVEIVENMANFSNVVQLTEPKTTVKCRDTKEPFLGTIKKLSRVSIILNSKYESNVLNQLKRENKEGNEYKKGINTMPLIKEGKNEFFGTFNGNAVIEYRPNPSTKPLTAYVLNGISVEKNTLPNVLPKQYNATNQGTEKEIFWRKLYVKNILQISINKVTYRVTDKVLI